MENLPKADVDKKKCSEVSLEDRIKTDDEDLQECI